jgi:hypothetical protein
LNLRHLPLILLLCTGGCGFLFKSPDKANIKLRKQIQGLEGQIAQLKQQHQADAATIEGLSERTGTTALLEPGRLDKLFTTHAIRVGRLSGGADLDASRPGDEGFKVYVNTLDQHGDMIKSAGSFVVEAFDLSDPQSPRLGHWDFPVEKAQENWHSFLTRYEYVLTCPWQQAVPRHPDVTVKLTFTDELTGRKFTAQHVAKVEVPPGQPPPQPVGALQ